MDDATLINSSWAIAPASLEKILSYDRDRLKDPVSDFKASEDSATYKERMEEFMRQFEEQLRVTEDGVGIIQVSGPLMPNPDAFDRFYYGAADSVRIASLIRAAAEAPEIESLVLSINSPGGMVIGTPEMGNAMRAFNDTGRESYAFTDTLMASGAYWLGSQAKNLIVTESALVGSIGVIRPHVDTSKLQDDLGVKIEIFRGGKHKVAGAYGTSLTDEQRKHIQDGVDDCHADFKRAVNEYRQIDEEDMQGQVFYGKDAIAHRLVDGTADDLSTLIGLATEGSASTPLRVSVDTTNQATMSDKAPQDEPQDQSVEQLSEDLDAANERIAALDAENEELASNLADANNELEEVRGELESANESANGLQVDLDAANEMIEELQGDLDSKVEELADKLAEVKAEQLAEAKAAEIAAQSGTDASDVTPSEDEDADIDSAKIALLDVAQLWEQHSEIKRENGQEAARAFYEKHIRPRQ